MKINLTPRWLHDLLTRNTRAELVAEIALLNKQYGKLTAAYERLFTDLEVSEKNVEQLRELCTQQREEIAMLEPRRAEAEKERRATEATIRQEFLNDTVVRGTRWGDMTEEQRAEVAKPTETSLRAAIRLLESRILALESTQVEA
jgi:chromosome segregation ATPase